MILIEESIPPRKLSGLSSFLISFQYDERIIEKIKQLEVYYYHKKDYKWEISENELLEALDSLTFLDDITLHFSNNNTNTLSEKPLTESEIQSFRLKPFDHQVDGINFGLDKSKWLLLDSMGLGKTNQIIWLAETLKRRGLIDHCLIVCGVDSLRSNWKKEIAKFSTEQSIVLGEKISKKGNVSYASVGERAIQLKNKIDEFFVIVNAATLRDDRIIEAFNKSENKFGLIAVDEVHKFATKTSQQGANLLKLKANYKVAATGTPLVNSPISCYVPLAWTENDHSTLTNYKSQYCTFGGFNNSQVIGFKNLEMLKEELENCSIRRTLDQVRDDMPSKTVTTELIEMSDQHKKFYDAIKKGVKEEADKVNLNSSNLLALTTRLRQATACPSILTTQEIISSKVERCCELVDDLMEQGQKVVIMSIFKEPVHQLAKLLAKYNPTVNTGDIPDAVVSKNVDDFQNNPDSKLFIGTMAKCGTGLTLNAASYMICLDQAWTAALNNQVYDRIYRVTNTKPVFITVLMCKDTIDERVNQVSQFKQDLSDYVIDNKTNELATSLKDEMLSIIKDL